MFVCCFSKHLKAALVWFPLLGILRDKLVGSSCTLFVQWVTCKQRLLSQDVTR